MESVKEIAGWFATTQKIAVITGAGMSTESGIPDFRSAKGLFREQTKKNIPIEDVLSRSFFEKYPKEFYRIYQEKLLYPNAEPNNGHYFLKKLEDYGHEVTIITQNIDGLHQKAGSQQVLEVHGNAGSVITQSGKHVPFEQSSLEEDGLYVEGEWARPAITLYGEPLDTAILNQSIEAVKCADILIIMGTSLNVYPAAGLIYDYRGTKSVLINKEPTPLDDDIKYVYRCSIREWGEALSAFL